MSVFAGLALLLAAVGIYRGVQAHAATQRTREIGIRVALGAEPRNVLGMILRESAGWTAIGLVVGLAGGLAASRLISNLLFGGQRMGSVTLLAAPAIILAVSVLASYVPGVQAMRVDPAVALRAE